MKRSRSPYGNTAKRKRALAWMAERGITQPRALYPCVLRLEHPRTIKPLYMQVAGRAKRLTSVS